MERAGNQVPIAGLRDAHPRMVAISIFRAAGAWAISGGNPARSAARSATRLCDTGMNEKSTFAERVAGL
jgi:hypothetical protein